MRWQANFSDPESVKKFPWWLFLAIGCGVPIVFIVIGAGLIYRNHVRRTTWVETPARVTHSEVASYTDDDGDRMHKVILEYQYSVGDKNYEGEYESSSTSEKGSMKRLVEKYPVGAEIKVRVNPKDASQSAFLEIFDWFDYFFLGFGLLLFTVFGSIGFFGLKKKKALLAKQSPP